MSDELRAVAGHWPPDVMPYCQICDLICESVVVNPFQHDHQDFLIIEASCCGQTSGSRISLRKVYEMKATGQKWYAIVRRGSQAGPRARKSTLRSISH